ncbi:MAG: hypothetical protein A4E57_04218 [Syntrophorhabdaceae bacterium PtaU1.Bin034]|nr:MAG: hypothetical protein A4E57_04218 [Syntrophorhabdaceae bacterium PtaU1.Bin034]
MVEGADAGDLKAELGKKTGSDKRPDLTRAHEGPFACEDRLEFLQGALQLSHLLFNEALGLLLESEKGGKLPYPLVRVLDADGHGADEVRDVVFFFEMVEEIVVVRGARAYRHGCLGDLVHFFRPGKEGEEIGHETKAFQDALQFELIHPAH